MKKNFKLIILILLLILSTGKIAFSQSLSSDELISNAKVYDGKLITYTGEVIGDVMSRGEFCWININDGQNALSFWVPVNLVSGIEYRGSYKSRGDVLELTGVFHRACLEHGGDLDVHVQSLRKVAPGRMINDRWNFDKVSLSLVLLGALLIVWTLTLLPHK